MIAANNAHDVHVGGAHNVPPAPVLEVAAPIPVGGAINPLPLVIQGILGANYHLQRQQANIAGGNIGNPIIYPAGTRTRNPDQADALDLMNR